MTYAISAAETRKQISGLPGPGLISVAKVMDPSILSKAAAIDVLASAVSRGQITISQIQAGAQGVTGTPVRTVNPDPKIESAAQAASRAESVALDAKALADRTAANLAGLINEARTLAGAVEGLTREVGTLRDTKADPNAAKAAIKATVEAALGPIIKAAKANKTTEKVKAAAHAPEIKTVAEVFGISLNDIKGNPLTVEFWNDPAAPAIDPNYIWQESILRALVVGAKTGTNVWLGGEKGTGKTQAAMQWAARTGRAFTRINFHKYTSAEEYLGATGLVNGQTQFVPGPFLTAYTHPGALILADEVTNADPGELAPLNGALERGTPRVNIGGQVWDRAPGVMVVAADNTMTNGDASGRYAGTRVMNSALADRFGYIVPVTWLPAAQESDALVRLTGCTPALADLVVQVLTFCRAKAASGDLVDAPSIRSAISWIEAMPTMGVRASWDIAVAARQPAESAVQLEAIYTAQVSIQAFEQALQ
jgi:MoxR-like ATPase